MTDSNVIRETITKQSEPTKFSNLESKAASKDEVFKVAMGSDVRPSELAYAGLAMKSFRFSPAYLEEVAKRLSDFVVIDESTACEKVFRFERLPY